MVGTSFSIGSELLVTIKLLFDSILSFCDEMKDISRVEAIILETLKDTS